METNVKPLWLTLLESAVRSAGNGGKQAVAKRLGISRTYVSRAMNREGKCGLPSPPQRFIDRVIDCYHVVAICPATLQQQARSECRRLALVAAPTHNPLSMRIWKNCQCCPHKPTTGEEK